METTARPEIRAPTKLRVFTRVPPLPPSLLDHVNAGDLRDRRRQREVLESAVDRRLVEGQEVVGRVRRVPVDEVELVVRDIEAATLDEEDRPAEAAVPVASEEGALDVVPVP